MEEVKYKEIILLGRNDNKNKQAEAIFAELGLQDRVKVYNNQALAEDELQEICGEADVSVVAFSPPSPEERPGAAMDLYDQVAALTRKGGVLSLYGGLPEHWPLLSPWQNHYREISYIGNSGAPARVLSWSHELIEKGILKKELLDALITHEYTLSEVNEALEASASREALKVLVRCNYELMGFIEIDGLSLRMEKSVSDISKRIVSNFNPIFQYTLSFYDGQRKVAHATVSVNENAILLPACTELRVEPGMRGRGIGTQLILQAFKGASEEAKLRGLSPKWSLFTVMQDEFEDHVDAAERLEPMSKILKKLDAKTYEWEWSKTTHTPIEYDDSLGRILQNLSPYHDSGVFVHFVELERVIDSIKAKKEVEIRDYENEEAIASVNRLGALINTFLENREKKQIQLKLDVTERSPSGFRRPGEAASVWLINSNILDRNAFLNEVAMTLGVTPEEQTSDEWKNLQNQIWLDGKLEFAVRDVPWMKETDIRITDLYDPKVRLLVGLGDVRGSASYQSFYVNYYRNNDLAEVQDIFDEAGYRMMPIPVQMEEDDLADIERLLSTVLKDNRIIRMAFTKPTKPYAVNTGLFKMIDPDTLDTGVVNTAAIEGEGSVRHFVRRTTDGLGTIAKAKESLTLLDRNLEDSIAGIIGLRGFGLAVLGKLLTDQNAPKEIRIAVRDKSVGRSNEALAAILKAYREKFREDPKSQVRIYPYSELDHAQDHHPFEDAAVIFDCTKVGMNDDNYSLSYLDFFHKDMVVFHAAYRDKDKNPRVPPILVEARKRGAIVHNGIADWLGHQYMQVAEDLKRASGLTPDMLEWNDPKWARIRAQLEKAAFRWANAQGLKDAMDLMKDDVAESDGHKIMTPEAIPELMEAGDYTRVVNWLANLWKDLPSASSENTIRDIAIEILHHRNCSEFLKSSVYNSPELNSMRITLEDKFGLTGAVRSIIAQWQIFISEKQETSQMPELALKESQPIWEAIRLLRDGRQMEIYVPQRFYNTFTKETKEAIERITRLANKGKSGNEKDKKVLNVRFYSDERHLMNILETAQGSTPNVQRMVITEKDFSPAIKDYLESQREFYNYFRGVRLYNMELPRGYYATGEKALSDESRTAHQARVLNIGIIARLIERGETNPILEGLLHSLLEGHINDDEMFAFIDNLLAKENGDTSTEDIAQRVISCLNKIVSLVDWLGQELRFMREFWRSA